MFGRIRGARRVLRCTLGGVGALCYTPLDKGLFLVPQPPPSKEPLHPEHPSSHLDLLPQLPVQANTGKTITWSSLWAGEFGTLGAGGDWLVYSVGVGVSV